MTTDKLKNDVLPEARAVTLLLKSSGKKKSDLSEEQKAEAAGLAGFLENFSPALILAGAYLERTPDCTFAQYKELLEKSPAPAGPEFSPQEKSLFLAIGLVRPLVEESPLLHQLIDLLTWSGDSPMSLSMATDLMDSQETGFLDALELGTDLKLLDKAKDGKGYSIHPTSRHLFRQLYPLAGREKWIVNTAKLLGDWFEERRKESGQAPEFRDHILHLDTWLEHVKPYSDYHTGRLTWLQAYTYFHDRELDEAKKHVTDGFALLEKAPEDSKEMQIQMYIDLGYINGDQGEWENTHAQLGKALDLQVELTGREHPDTAQILDTIGNTYDAMGNLDEAVKHFKEALEIRREKLGEEHADTAGSLNELGTTLYQNGQYTNAIEYLEKALKIRTKVLGETDPNTADSFYNIAVCMINLKKFKEAFDRVSAYLKKLPEDHPQYRELASLIPYIDKECVKSGFRPLSMTKTSGKSSKKKKKKKKKK